MNAEDYDCGKYGERGAVAGRPDLDCNDGIDHLGAIWRALRTPQRVETQPVRVSQALLDEARQIREAREAQEALAERSVLTPAELDHWSALLAEEATCMGRHHRKAPINPHD